MEHLVSQARAWLAGWVYEYRRADPYRRVGRAYDPHRPRMRRAYDGVMLAGGRGPR
jgi:hypothetical protein